RLRLQKSRRLQGSKIKVMTVNGGVVCVNPLCPAVRARYASRPRDSIAALNILLAMASVSLRDSDESGDGGMDIDQDVQADDVHQGCKDPPWPLLPYARYVRPQSLPTINTGKPVPEHHEKYGFSNIESSQICTPLGFDSIFSGRISNVLDST
ncbi:hypothetical protein BGZ75_006134, partial [Mortierella antarctica]